MKFTTEDDIEQYNLELLDALGYSYTHGGAIAPAHSESPSPTDKEASDLRSPSPRALSITHKYVEVLREVDLGDWL